MNPKVLKAYMNMVTAQDVPSQYDLCPATPGVFPHCTIPPPITLCHTPKLLSTILNRQLAETPVQFCVLDPKALESMNSLEAKSQREKEMSWQPRRDQS